MPRPVERPAKNREPLDFVLGGVRNCCKGFFRGRVLDLDHFTRGGDPFAIDIEVVT